MFCLRVLLLRCLFPPSGAPLPLSSWPLPLTRRPWRGRRCATPQHRLSHNEPWRSAAPLFWPRTGDCRSLARSVIETPPRQTTTHRERGGRGATMPEGVTASSAPPVQKPSHLPWQASVSAGTPVSWRQLRETCPLAAPSPPYRLLAWLASSTRPCVHLRLRFNASSCFLTTV